MFFEGAQRKVNRLKKDIFTKKAPTETIWPERYMISSMRTEVCAVSRSH